ncbi:g6f-like [Astyanax mexicanus]|uniref:g6f-like n=1 Tax=Astyanax mexicanus TaxID=7994 RepID=UPI0020CAF19F|nr:g6f-like [Astyanax mexicanus]
MRSASLCFVLICVHQGLIFPSGADRVKDWTDVVMVPEGTAVTLRCSDGPAVLSERVTWMMMRPKENRWTSVFSVNTSRGVTGRLLSKLGDKIIQIFEDVSLQFTASANDGGRYSCLMMQGSETYREKITLLALVKLILAPAPPVPVNSTLRLEAQVSPVFAVAGGTWLSPADVPLLTVAPSPGTLLTKLPWVNHRDNGLYTCSIHISGQSSKSQYNFTMSVKVDENKVASVPNIIYDPTLSKASLAQSTVTLSCPSIHGDYVRVYWWCADCSKVLPKKVFQSDRWRNHMISTPKPRLQLQDNGENISFLLRPELDDAGQYQCEVFLNDKVYGQSTTVTVLKGNAKSSSSSLDLTCTYAMRSQVAKVKWIHIQRPNFQLPVRAVIGRLTASVALPVTPKTAGQYACTLQLKSGQTVRYTYNVPLTPTERPCCGSDLPAKATTDHSAEPPLPPAEPSAVLSALSLLLFVVPVVAVAVGMLLWRRGCCSSRQNVDVERTLSHYSGEVENIYENPEDLRQSSPHGAVYMDLKPTGEADVYKELDRYDPCCG